MKDTLNLPKTKFSMKANLAQKEPEILKFWEEINLYDALQEQNKDKPNLPSTTVLHMPMAQFIWVQASTKP